MNINIIMNSISDAHSNNIIKDFENQGFDVNMLASTEVSLLRKETIFQLLATLPIQPIITKGL